MNHSFIEDGPKPVGGGDSSIFDKNNSTFEDNSPYLFDESRARLFSEERPSQGGFLPRLDASQRYSNSQVIHREHHHHSHSHQPEEGRAVPPQARERAADMSMRSPSNSWINDSLQKIAHNSSSNNNSTTKKAVFTDRKTNPAGGASLTVAHTNSTSASDFNKIFKPNMKASSKAPLGKHQKHQSQVVAASSAIAAVHLYSQQQSLIGAANEHPQI